MSVKTQLNVCLLLIFDLKQFTNIYVTTHLVSKVANVWVQTPKVEYFNQLLKSPCCISHWNTRDIQHKKKTFTIWGSQPRLGKLYEKHLHTSLDANIERFSPSLFLSSPSQMMMIKTCCNQKPQDLLASKSNLHFHTS